MQSQHTALCVSSTEDKKETADRPAVTIAIDNKRDTLRGFEAAPKARRTNRAHSREKKTPPGQNPEE